MSDDAWKDAQEERVRLSVDYRTGSWWIHSKSQKRYQILGLSVDEKTLQLCVVYWNPLSGETMHRPWRGGGNGWTDEIEVSEGVMALRFTLVLP